MIAALEEAFWVRSEPLFLREQFQPVLAHVLGDDIAQEVSDAVSDIFTFSLVTCNYHRTCANLEAPVNETKGATQEIEELLEANTELAFLNGAFGLPWFEATDAKGLKESFFGFDHLGHVVDHLGLEKPLTAESMEKMDEGWRAMM